MEKAYLPSFKSLHFFMVAGQKLSFKQAAQSLNVTQAAVSQQVRSLEEYIGQALFYRNSRNTCLTETGARLLPYIENGFDQFQTGLRAISGDLNPHILRVSAIHSFTSLWLMPRLPDFQSQHPELMIQIAPSNEITNFETDEVDLAIRMGGGNYKGLKEIKLMRDDLVFVASPRLIETLPNKKITAPKEVFSLPWIEDPSPQTQEIFNKACEHYDVDAKTMTASIRSNNSMILIEHALAAKGFTFINRGLVAQYLISGELEQVLDFEETSPWSLYLVAPEHHFNWQKVANFQTWILPELRTSFGDVEAW
uniref:LysR substrate-binding domain-containing protein n=1 Tax=Ningiella ruwaisensis TaxID=2364274 RepID=UPI0010A07D74|nr:LysR substrate-binding domain-containing protein [Ningiella ruwaisensis]